MTKLQKSVFAIFYCKNVPQSSEENRKELEKEYGEFLRLFPLPCGGRLEQVHLLRALEEYADVAWLITCPEGSCRYFEGNLRAVKRVELARSAIASIGLEKERVGITVGSMDVNKTLEKLIREIMEKASGLGPSPVHRKSI